MDIKIKGTTRAGILVYDLNDADERYNMELAQKAALFTLVIEDFFDKLRTLRKYNGFEPIDGVDITRSKKQIVDSEEYYRLLLIKCLKEYDLLHLLNR